MYMLERYTYENKDLMHICVLNVFHSFIALVYINIYVADVYGAGEACAIYVCFVNHMIWRKKNGQPFLMIILFYYLLIDS